MTLPTIRSDMTSSELNVVDLLDPLQIEAYRVSVATQINNQRMAQPNPKQVLDLSDWISDIMIETTVQGASLLEVHVIDPGWIMLLRDKDGVAFFDTDQNGYLWPPIEVNFPADSSDAVWRLCQLRPSTDITQANLILTFEDRVAAELREFLGPVLSSPNQTRAEFIQQLVKEVKFGKPLPPVAGLGYPVVPPGQKDGKIRFIPLLPHLDFTAADLTADETTIPKSAKQKNPPPARANHTKKPTVVTVQPNPDEQGQNLVNSPTLSIADYVVAHQQAFQHYIPGLSPLPAVIPQPKGS